jgi:4'-phosphopantetheinyl transferase
MEPTMRPLGKVLGAQLWLVDLSVTPSATALASLSGAERARAARFVFAEHRRRFEVAHGALRALLALETSLPAGDLEFVAGPHDKPALTRDQACVFNMSHSDARGLIAIARGMPAGLELGVDIESLRAVEDTRALAAAHFTVAEQAELAACVPAARTRMFLSGWTRKEACLKAVGSGLSIAPATFECGLSPGNRVTRIATSRGAVTVEVESVAIDEQHVAAIAVTRS